MSLHAHERRKTEVATQLGNYLNTNCERCIMVELELDDYRIIFAWFERTYGRRNMREIKLGDRRAFWKLMFLHEDKIRDERDRMEEYK